MIFCFKFEKIFTNNLTVHKVNALIQEHEKDAAQVAKEALEHPPQLVFEGNSASTEENIHRIQNIFGGSLVGKRAGKSSSRYFSNNSYTIAGVKVPMKPTEPDNCCMSGCVNCVWELYNDDMKEYHHQRKLAAEQIKQKGGIWPLKLNPPIKWLGIENLPKEIRNKSKEEIAQIIADDEFLENNANRWESVSMSVFADLEKNLKKKPSRQNSGAPSGLDAAEGTPASRNQSAEQPQQQIAEQ